jgi:hypothetical protein
VSAEGVTIHLETGAVCVAPNPYRDARVAARRAADAARAGAALDRLLADMRGTTGIERHMYARGYKEGWHEGWLAGNAASDLHHKGNYGVRQCYGLSSIHPHPLGTRAADCPECPHPCDGGRCPDPVAHAEGAHDV